MKSNLIAFWAGAGPLVGVLLGAWLTWRTQSRLRTVELRTKIADEVNEITARYYLILSGVPAENRIVGADEILIPAMVLDAKVRVHFSKAAYETWRGVEEMIASGVPTRFTASDFSEARRKAIDAFGKELV